MPYKTRGVIVTFIVSLLTVPLTAAQPLAKIPRIGILHSETPPTEGVSAFQHALREFGYVRGRPSPWSSDGRRGSSIASPSSRPSWWVSRSQ